MVGEALVRAQLRERRLARKAHAHVSLCIHVLLAIVRLERRHLAGAVVIACRHVPHDQSAFRGAVAAGRELECHATRGVVVGATDRSRRA